MKIKTFIDRVGNARKRTAIVFMEDHMKATIDGFKTNNVKIIDCSELVTDEVILSDDQLLKLILDAAIGKKALILNFELFIATRIDETYFLQSFLRKLMVKEPLEPIFILFYSKMLYDKFKNFYTNHKPTETHYLDNSEGEA
jgi:hypothetical protein